MVTYKQRWHGILLGRLKGKALECGQNCWTSNLDMRGYLGSAGLVKHSSRTMEPRPSACGLSMPHQIQLHHQMDVRQGS